MNYFKFVIDLDRIGNTVENMFHVKQRFNIVDIINFSSYFYTFIVILILFHIFY